MNTFFCELDEEQYNYIPTEWSKNSKGKRVKISDPVTIEYRRIHIRSDEFDLFGKSEIMIVSHIRNAQRKERSMENIVYSDDNVKYSKTENGDKIFSIGPFDTSKYGNPVFFHTPGYQGTVLSITTKMWELDSPDKLISFTNMLRKGVGLVTSMSPYFVVADKMLEISAAVVSGHINHDKMCKSHTLELRTDKDKPFMEGKYLCVPNLQTVKSKRLLLQNYTIEDNMLVDKEYNEYPHTYFIVEISTNERDDLADFDFMASSAELIDKFQRTVEYSDILVNVNRESYNYQLILLVKESYDKWVNNIDSSSDESLRDTTLALYKQLRDETKKYFDETLPEVYQALYK